MSKKIKDIKGHCFGRLIAKEFYFRDKIKRKTKWKCECECGKIIIADMQNLQSGNTKSCGCLESQLLSQRNKLNRIYNLNETYFDSIDNEEKAYFLGFIIGDGFIGKNIIKISLHSKDKEILESFKTSIQSTAPIKYFKSRCDQDHVILCLGSEKLCKRLKLMGILHNKTLSINQFNFDCIPNNLFRHFMRGLFDADGNIFIPKNNRTACRFSIIGNEDFLFKCQTKMMENININRTKLYHPPISNKVATMYYSGMNNISKIFDYLYQDATVFLHRKKNYFMKIITNRIINYV